MRYNDGQQKCNLKYQPHPNEVTTFPRWMNEPEWCEIKQNNWMTYSNGNILLHKLHQTVTVERANLNAQKCMVKMLTENRNTATIPMEAPKQLSGMTFHHHISSSIHTIHMIQTLIESQHPRHYILTIICGETPFIVAWAWWTCVSWGCGTVTVTVAWQWRYGTFK